MTQPLAGRTVLVTRPLQQAAALAQAIHSAGGATFEFPALDIEAVPADRTGVPLAQSGRGRHRDFHQSQCRAIWHGGHPGEGTAAMPRPGFLRWAPARHARLQAQGLTEVITPQGQDSEALLALPQLQDVAGRRVLIVRGVGGRALLADTLRARGAEVHFLECYRRMRPQADALPLLAHWQAGGIDAVTVTSAEALHNLGALLGEAGSAPAGGHPAFRAA